MLKNKNPQDSIVEVRHIIMPNNANPHGHVFGGQIMAWIDLAAAMVAMRHAEVPVSTVHVEEVTFESPVLVGNHVHILACLNYVGTTSMEVGVKVMVENPFTGSRIKTTKAYLRFVAMGKDGRPVHCHELTPVSEDEIRRFNRAKDKFAKVKKSHLEKV